MDPIIGEFTITSGSDPAIFHTSFPRSVRLDEGYEIALKSIYHAPVNNLVHNKFRLHTSNSNTELELDSRFYESPSDILLAMHKEIGKQNFPIPLLFEKDGHMKMRMAPRTWIEVNEAMFLNRTFKYVLYDESEQFKRGIKRRKTSPVEENSEKAEHKHKQITNRISNMKTSIEEFKDFIELHEKVDEGLIDSLILLKKQFLELEQKVNTNTKFFDERWVKMDNMEVQFNTFESSLKLIQENLENLKRTFATDKAMFNAEVLKVSNSIKEAMASFQAIQDDIAANKAKIETVEGQVVILANAVDAVSYTLSNLNENMQRVEEPDIDHKYAIDMPVASRLRQKLLLTEISVPMSSITKTDIGFLYASLVENSLIDNRETRLLTAFPIESKRGYSYFEFAQPIYRSIAVRQFMDISFEILDQYQQKANFSLYGDDQDMENRKYRTILNLHIRRAIKGKTDGL